MFRIVNLSHLPAADPVTLPSAFCSPARAMTLGAEVQVAFGLDILFLLNK